MLLLYGYVFTYTQSIKKSTYEVGAPTGRIPHNAYTRMVMDTTKMLCIIKQIYQTHLPVVLNVTVCHLLVCDDGDEHDAQLNMDTEV
jgi:hypothetical protein